MRIEDVQVDGAGPTGASGHNTVVEFERKGTRMLKPARDSRLDEYFPDVDSGHTAVGVRVMVQLKFVPAKTKGGIIITQESQEVDQASMPYGKVISVGGQCGWSDGVKHDPEFKIGDFVRIPKWGGDRLKVNGVTFVYFNWWDVIGKIDPEILL